VGLGRRAQSDSEHIELVSAQRRLDPTKQRPLLVADVIPQMLAESVECHSVNRRGLEITDPPSDVRVLDKHPHHIAVVSPDVTRERGKEQLLLEAKMPATLLPPEIECRLPDGLSVSIGGALQPKGQLKRHMVLTRQHRQRV
jgi:hypothetical protein